MQEGAPVRAAQAKLESLREAGSHGNVLEGQGNIVYFINSLYIYIKTYIYINTYIYICVCCVCF